jgi:hypothetical protein
MDRIVVVEEKVEDLYGLYMDLRRSEFAIKNVGADNRGTYVYVDELEEKDPVPTIRAWVWKVAPEPSLSLKKKRTKEYEDILEVERKAAEAKRAAEEEAARKVAADGGLELLKSTDEPLALESSEIKDDEGKLIGELLGDTPKEGFFKRIWKKLF